MKYDILIYTGSEVLTALNVSDEAIQHVSMGGNITHPADDVTGFYENILDYYNVDSLSEISAGVRIINAETDAKNIRYLFDKLTGLSDFSLWKIKELIPFVLLQKNMISQSSSVKVKIYDNCYIVSTDKDFNFSIDYTNAKPDFEFCLEDFTVLNNFNGKKFSSDLQETDKLKSLIENLEQSEKKLKKDLILKNRYLMELERELSELKQNTIEMKKITETSDIKSKVINYLNDSVNPSDYKICTHMKDESVFVAIENIKTGQYYNFSIKYLLSNDYVIEQFRDDLYKKIANSLHMIQENYEYNSLRNSRYAELNVGDVFDFGQTHKKSIKWRVIDKKDNTLLVLSEVIICERAYTAGEDVLVHNNEWENSDTRKWLNNTFFNGAFSPGEKKFILKVNNDNITLLSSEEVNSFLTKQERKRDITWFLRSPYRSSSGGGFLGMFDRNYIEIVDMNGNISNCRYNIINGIRPAFYLKF